jgi:hypothetical protein
MPQDARRGRERRMDPNTCSDGLEAPPTLLSEGRSGPGALRDATARPREVSGRWVRAGDGLDVLSAEECQERDRSAGRIFLPDSVSALGAPEPVAPLVLVGLR